MQKIIIFGCGEQGRVSYPKLAERYEIIAFSDNNSALWGENIAAELPGKQNITVIPPMEIKERLGDGDEIIICNMKHYDEIARQLKGYGIEKYMVCYNGALARCDLEGKVRFGDFYKDTAISPSKLHIGLSGFCNIRCRYCMYHEDRSTWEARKAHMSWDTVREIAKQAKSIPTLEAFLLIGFGETVLNPNWYEMTNYLLEETSIRKVTFYTNGMALNKENSDKLARLRYKSLTFITSIDGISPKDSEFWRKGSSYSVIKENLYYAYSILDREKTRFLISGCVVLPSEFKEERDWRRIEAYTDSCGDFLRKDFPQATVQYKAARAYVEIPGTGARKYYENAIIPCMNLFDVIGLDHNGDIMSCPCALGYEVIGNVMSDNMYDVWLNHPLPCGAREAFRRGERPDMCDNCGQVPGIRRLLVRNEELVDSI